MWFLRAPAAVLGLVAIAHLPSTSAKPYPVHIDELADTHNATQVQKRDCPNGGTVCGWYGQICCSSGETCYTDANNQAQCGAPGQNNGQWVYSTTVWVENGPITHTSVYSTFVGATANAQPTATCTDSQSPCGSKCCDSGYYCLTSGQCALIGGGSSGGIIGTLTPSAPLRPTSSTLIIVTATGSPTATVPFETPIATGVNGTLVESNGGGGLSGGAIAGIVIGVILGLLLLLLICLFCCARAIFDRILAIFGLGGKRRHTHEETYIEEHHHSSGGGGRRWYGQGPARPSRPHKSGGGMGNMLGMGAALGGLALALGLKRRHDRKHDDKSTTVTDSSYYYSDYTSSSSASSDRRTRNTRTHSSRR